MARTGYRDVGFEVPDAWQDDTVLRFVGPKQSGLTDQPEITVARKRLAPNESVDALASRELMEIARERETFKLEESRVTELCGIRAIEQRFSWEGWERKTPTPAGSGLVAQRQIVVAVNGRGYVITVTCPHAQAGRTMPLMDRIVNTIRFEQPGWPAER